MKKKLFILPKLISVYEKKIDKHTSKSIKLFLIPPSIFNIIFY